MLSLSGCAAPGLLGLRDVTHLEGGTTVTRTLACGAYVSPAAANPRVIVGCLSDVTVRIPPGACQAVFVTSPTYTTNEVLQHLDPLLPDTICPERIAPYE